MMSLKKEKEKEKKKKKKKENKTEKRERAASQPFIARNSYQHHYVMDS